jgi:hypothetical protein
MHWTSKCVPSDILAIPRVAKGGGLQLCVWSEQAKVGHLDICSHTVSSTDFWQLLAILGKFPPKKGLPASLNAIV